MRKYTVEQFARTVPKNITAAVRSASEKKILSRQAALSNLFENPDQARSEAAKIKDEMLDHHSEFLAQFQDNAKNNGFKLHHAKDAEEACKIILELCQRHLKPGDPNIIVKAKSMATEEIELNHFLEANGFQPIETDLGEFVVQIDHDTPSHIVTPIIHKKLPEVAKSFERENLGTYTENPEELTMQARRHLRKSFKQAKIGISGVNFALANTGQIVLIENEGNNRLTATAPSLHIALMGIEKLLPRASDLPLFLKLLAGSATGQKLTTYTHIIGKCEESILHEIHIVLLDNGRSNVLNGKYRSVLRCIRCGACLNGCPVYREVSGHAYQNVYPGPIGAVLAPAMWGVEKYGDLPFASSLCGLCEEVCPVQIPLPKMLVELRDEAVQTRKESADVWKGFQLGGTHPSAWRNGIKLLGLAEATGLIRIGAKLNSYPSGWSEFRELPSRKGRDFRKWNSKRNADSNPEIPHPNRSAGNYESNFEDISEVSQSQELLWDLFKNEIELLNGKAVMLCEASFEDNLKVIADEDVPKDILLQIFPNHIIVESPWDADVGVTMADSAISESGSILVQSLANRSRLTSLAPAKHVALLPKGRLFARLQDALKCDESKTSVIIAGPSRTSDIEGISIRGVHGPGQVTVIHLP